MKSRFLACALVLVSSAAFAAVTVVDRQGKPVAGARLALPGADPGSASVTDAAGAAALAPGAAMTVEAAGFLPWSGNATERITLTRPSAIDVRALDDETGRAVAGVKLTLLPPAAKDKPAPEPLATTKSGADGRATFEGLTAGAYRVRAEAPGHVSRESAAAPAAEQRDAIKLELPRALTLTGTVRAGKDPVAGALVRPVDTRERSGPWRPARRAQAEGTARARPQLTTDARGQFRTEELHARRRDDLVLVAIGTDGRWGVALVPASPERGAPASSVQVDIDVAGNRSASGRVTWSDGTPAAGVTVVAELAHDRGPEPAGYRRGAESVDVTPAFEDLGGGPVTTTGPEGEFNISGLPPTGWVVTARPDGRPPSAGVAADLREADASALAISLVAGATVEGRVVDAQGAPIPDARVRGLARPRRDAAPSREPPAPVETLTAADGTFELAGLPDGRVRLNVEADGFGTDERDLEPGASPRIVLRRAGTLTGRAVSGVSGEPLGRFRVVPIRADGTEELPGRAPRTEEVVAPDGVFRVAGLGEGRWAARIEAEGHLARTVDPVQVPGGGEASLGDVLLSEGGSVRGVVVDADTQQPIAGAAVTADGGDSRRRWAALQVQAAAVPSDTTDEQGRFTLAGLPPGELSLSAQHAEYPGRGQGAVAVTIPEAGGAEVEAQLRLVAGGSARATVLDSSGAPVAGAWVQAHEPGSGSRAGRGLDVAVQAGADGVALLQRLPRGEVVVRRSDRVDGGATVTVRPRETVDVVLRETGARVHGRILAGDVPVAARVRLMGGSHRPRGTDLSETYEIEGVPAGTASLEVVTREPMAEGSPQLRSHRVTLEVPEGARDVAHDIVLEPEDHADDVVAFGRVQDADTGDGLDGWLVSARRTGLAHPISTTTVRGDFALALPDEGRWVLNARPPGPGTSRYAPPPEATVEVGPDGVSSPPPVMLARRRAATTVRLLDSGGQPVVGARLSLLHPSRNRGKDGIVRLTQAPGVTDALGSADVTADEPGTHDLLVLAPPRALVVFPRVEAGGDGEVVLQLPPTGGLRVPRAESVDLTETASGSTWTFRLGEGGAYPPAESGPQGMVFTGLAAGTYRLTVGGVQKVVEVRAGAVAEP